MPISSQQVPRIPSPTQAEHHHSATNVENHVIKKKQNFFLLIISNFQQFIYEFLDTNFVAVILAPPPVQAKKQKIVIKEEPKSGKSRAPARVEPPAPKKEARIFLESFYYGLYETGTDNDSGIAVQFEATVSTNKSQQILALPNYLNINNNIETIRFSFHLQ